MESWVLTQTSEKKNEPTEMYIYFGMLKISYLDHVTNREMLIEMPNQAVVLYTVRTKKLKYYGHMHRYLEKYHLLHLVQYGEIIGHRIPGRRKLSREADMRR